MKKKKVRLNRNGKILVGILAFLIVVLVCCLVFQLLMSPVNKKDSKNYVVIMEAGDTYSSIADFLEEQGLIRSSLGYKIHIKLHPPKETLKAGKHYLRKSMTLNQIVEELGKSPQNTNVMTITFKEGLNMRQVAEIISKNTTYSSEEVITFMSNSEYLDKLIQNYWFLTDEIKNPQIYYPLEGYLYPNTYEFDKGASIEDIVKVMLDETARQLEPYKDEFSKSSYTVHQIMTVASMSEIEAISESDREQVARVFYNRLNANMSLGSDVTTYYAARVNVGERDLYMSEINDANAYNTRSASMAGKLPVGPICNPSISAIKTAIAPAPSDYLYFVADKNRKVYFTKTDAEHNAIINQLRSEGLWYEFE